MIAFRIKALPWLSKSLSSQSQNEVHHPLESYLEVKLDSPPQSNAFEVSSWTETGGLKKENMKIQHS